VQAAGIQACCGEAKTYELNEKTRSRKVINVLGKFSHTKLRQTKEN
jgi:hypothetical protein